MRRTEPASEDLVLWFWRAVATGDFIPPEVRRAVLEYHRRDRVVRVHVESLANTLAKRGLITMANVTRRVETETRPRTKKTYEVASGVTLFEGSLVGLQGGFLDHWADGEEDRFVGIVEGGDLTGTISGTELAWVNDLGPELLNLASVGGEPEQGKVGQLVYASSSDPDDITLDPTGRTHPIGRLTRVYSSGTLSALQLFTPEEARMQLPEVVEPPPPIPQVGIPVASLVSWNEPAASREFVPWATLDFSEGLWDGLTPLRTEAGVEVQYQTFGAKWQRGGGHRYAEIALPKETLGADAESTTLIEIGTPTAAAAAFALDADVAAATVTWTLHMGANDVTITADFSDLSAWTLEWDGPYLRRYRFVQPEDTTALVVFEVVVDAYAGVKEAQYHCRIDPKDSSSTSVLIPGTDVDLTIAGADHQMVHADRCSVQASGTDSITYDLFDATGNNLAEGQSFSIIGMLAFGSETARLPVYPISNGWGTSYAHSPWKVLVPMPSGYDLKTEQATFYSTFFGSMMERPRVSLTINPEAPGQQNSAFGPIALHQLLHGEPYWRKTFERDGLTNGVRPTHKRYPADEYVDMTQYTTAAQEAAGNDVMYWQEQVWGQVGGFLWGKTRGTERSSGWSEIGGPGGAPAVGGNPPDKWKGRDQQHWNASVEFMLAILTSHPWAKREAEVIANNWLAECRTTASNPNMNNPSIGRTVGRLLLAGTYAYMLTGWSSIRDRLVDYVDMVITKRNNRQPAGKGPLWWLDDRWPLGVGCYYHGAWLDGIGVMGLDAVYQVIDYQPALDLARLVAEYCLETHIHYQSTASGGSLSQAYQYEYQAATGTTITYITGQNVQSSCGVTIPSSTALLEWCIPMGKFGLREFAPGTDAYFWANEMEQWYAASTDLDVLRWSNVI